MLEMLRELVAHKGYANACFLARVRQHAGAASDPAIVDLLQHVLIANRFWSCAIRRVPFAAEEESRTPQSLGAIAEAYRRTQDEEAAWLESATDADCAASLVDPLIPGGTCSVAQAFMQVCMHSQGHRAQLAKLLRGHGVEPPKVDFILWVAGRPATEWGVESAPRTG